MLHISQSSALDEGDNLRFRRRLDSRQSNKTQTHAFSRQKADENVFPLDKLSNSKTLIVCRTFKCTTVWLYGRERTVRQKTIDLSRYLQRHHLIDVVCIT